MSRWRPVVLAVAIAVLGIQPAAAVEPLVLTYDTSADGMHRVQAIDVAGDGTVWVGGSVSVFPDYRTRILRLDPFDGEPIAPAFGVATTGSLPGVNDLIVDGDHAWLVDQTDHTIIRAKGNAISPGYPKPSGGTTPKAIAIGVDDDLWVPNLNSNDVTRINPATGVKRTGYPKTTGSIDPSNNNNTVGPADVTIGNDGDVWLAIYNADTDDGEVSRLDKDSGLVKSGYPKPFSTVTMSSKIATGTDGDIWIAHESSSLSRLDPTTGLQRAGYPKFTGHSFLHDMEIGPDGDVWLTAQAFGGEIIRRDGETGDAVAGYPLNVDDQWNPGAIAFAANGDPWVTLDGAGFHGVAHISLSGQPPPPPKRALTVALAGAGKGTVTGQGIVCPGDCSQLYNRGAAVTLKAAPAASSTFKGWSGACTGTGDCKLTMSAARTVTATFAKKPVSAPQTKIKKLEVGGHDATVKFKGSGGTKPLKFQCKLDGAKKWKGCKSPLKLADLKDGEHKIRVRAVDAAGRKDKSPAKKTFSL